MKNLNILEEARHVFDLEIEALKRTRDSLDSIFIEILTQITNCKGKVIITGMGKPGHIAQKLAATFSSLGTPSFCLHPAEAMHGDLGMVSEDDVVIAISYSGESDEILRILPNIKYIGAHLIGITAKADSTLAHHCDIVQILPEFNEACHLGLAPTSSTTAELCYGDALAVVASQIYEFSDTDFGRFHPAGTLGKKLLITVADIMKKDEKNAVVPDSATLQDAIVELAKKGLGIVSIVNDKGILNGVITDGDLRRQLASKVDVYSLPLKSIMTKNPETISSSKMAIEALTTMRNKNINCIPVLNNNNIPIGTIRLQDILSAGIV
ncbi:MAG: KpsF/GutQ family sugar-phosphate isomerase [Treponema sp.]|nr:KpsF/GutQ family sugar-phosphate isomerase [Spirochaetia bacterium]MDD7014778.1 KpsF/GutQ family sugar-phosphate isomerase [Spirochaetales bacterium]MDY4901416.1 KpsF/GutQ family sugar-phosphate isomerase [Treponema sp.]